MNKVNFSTINFDGTITEDELYNEGTEIIKSEHLPSFVDDVVEYNSFSDFPEVGESGKIYVAKDTGKTYRWSGSQYTLVSSSSAEDIAYDSTLPSHTANSVGAKLAQLDEEINEIEAEIPTIVPSAVPNYSELPLLCGQPPILFGAATPQEAVVPTNWRQFDPETGEGYNWNGGPSAEAQQYINTSVTSGGRYIAVKDGLSLTWKNF